MGYKYNTLADINRNFLWRADGFIFYGKWFRYSSLKYVLQALAKKLGIQVKPSLIQTISEEESDEYSEDMGDEDENEKESDEGNSNQEETMEDEVEKSDVSDSSDEEGEISDETESEGEETEEEGEISDETESEGDESGDEKESEDQNMSDESESEKPSKSEGGNMDGGELHHVCIKCNKKLSNLSNLRRHFKKCLI
jgi:hypothetical protein